MISAAGVPQFAAILGNCVAGGGYLPVLCDKLLMTEGSGLYLAGPALVKAAIGQTVSHEDLGGAAMHAAVSGTIDFREPDEPSLPGTPAPPGRPAAAGRRRVSTAHRPPAGRRPTCCTCFRREPRQEYDIRDLLPCMLDAGPFDEYKAEYGQTLVCGYGRLGGVPVGVVANQQQALQAGRAGRCSTAASSTSTAPTRRPASSWTATRRGCRCCSCRTSTASWSAAIRSRPASSGPGPSWSTSSPTASCRRSRVILGGSFGAGNYALCGKAFDPRFIFAWPTARYAVMGGEQAASTLLDITVSALKRGGHEPDAEEMEELRRKVEASYQEQTDVRYAAARLWVDEILEPAETRAALLTALAVATRYDDGRRVQDGGVAGVGGRLTPFADQPPRRLRENSARNQPCSASGCA